MSWLWQRWLSWQSVKLWAQALRVHFISASLIPVLLGTVVARSETPISGWRFLLVLVGVGCYHGGANLINDLYDEEADRQNQQPSLFNGGSRVLPNNLVSAEQMKKAAALCYALGTGCAIVLVLTGGGLVALLYALAGLVLGYFYSAPPLRLAATGLGELCVGLAFGPFLVVGTTAVFTGRFLSTALFVSLPVGILITTVILINELPDLESDRQVGKGTLVVRLGRERSLLLLTFLLVLASSLMFAVFIRLGAPRYWIGSFLTLPLVVWLWSRQRGGLKQTPRSVLANAGMILLHLASGLLLIITLVKRGS
ncbi:MAG: prenyltransferase [Firmicutes bacterium]|nr:prenyltransferase [Bacillota bacterium]